MALNKVAQERLEHELLLSKGGGIYFDKARVDPIDTEATLYIGLGGTGADVLIRVKNEIKRRMVLPRVKGVLESSPRNIGFLAIDTDASVAQKTWGSAVFDPVSEFCSIAVNALPAIVEKWKKSMRDGEKEADWFDGVDSVAALPGAGAIRQIGRLMLFQNVKSVYEAIKTKITRIADDNNLSRVNIVVAAGIAGGTGSGTFIDIAYLARQVLSDLGKVGANVYAYLVMPDVNVLRGGQPNSLWRNGFAALKELDYWMSIGEQEQDDKFERYYGSGVDVNDIRSTPFTYCHLVTANGIDGLPLGSGQAGYDAVIDHLAENAFAYIAGEVAQNTSGNSSMSSMYSNIDNAIREITLHAKIPACYRYLAIGSRKIEIPFDELTTLLAALLFDNLKDTFARKPTKESFIEDLETLRLEESEVIHGSLTEDVGASPLDSNTYSYQDIWGGSNTGAKNNAAYDDYYQWSAQSFQTTVTRNTASWAHDKNGRFRQKATDVYIGDPKYGPRYLATLLFSGSEFSLIPTLKKYAEHCDGCARTAKVDMREMEKKLDQVYNEGKGKLFQKKKYAEQYVAVLRTYAENDCATYVYPRRAEVIRKLCEDLQKHYDLVLKPLDDLLEFLPEIFTQNIAKLEREQKDAEKNEALKSTKLIWPTQYVQEHKDVIKQKIKEGRKLFLVSLAKNLHTWTGLDFEREEAGTAETDIPGFLSEFIGEHFLSILTINMETIIHTKAGQAGLDMYLRDLLTDMEKFSIPLFFLRPQYEKINFSSFGLLSVPSNSEKIKGAALDYANHTYTGEKLTVKPSKEVTRLFFVKVLSGIPLYAYAKVEDSEEIYEKSRARSLGIHLDVRWGNLMPTPLHQMAWTPGVYANSAVQSYNDKVRTAFDFCMANNVIRPDNPDSPMKYYLYMADPDKADVSTFDFSAYDSIEEKLAALQGERDSLWEAKRVELIITSDGFARPLSEQARECCLRLPRLSSQILRQAEIVQGFAEKERELIMPRYFADCLVVGLIRRERTKLVLRRALNAVGATLLYDVTQEKPFPEYEAYLTFFTTADAPLQEQIDDACKEMLERIHDHPNVRNEVIARVDEAITVYGDTIPRVKARMSCEPSDRRVRLQSTLAFYASVLGRLRRFSEDYLLQ